MKYVCVCMYGSMFYYPLPLPPTCVRFGIELGIEVKQTYKINIAFAYTHTFNIE